MYAGLALDRIKRDLVTVKTSSEVIGTADVTVEIVMQSAGLQIALTKKGKTERVTKLWSDF